jgi:predicted ester cyclase
MSSAVQTNQLEGQNGAKQSSSEAEGERNKALVQRLFGEGFSKGDLSVADEMVAPDCKEHQYFGPNHPDGPEGVKNVIRDLRRLFPDFTLTADKMVAVGDEVWVRATGRGTHGGEFMGRPPTGKQVKVGVIDICRFENGKLVEHWGVPDRFHMMVQLGMIPTPQ